MVKNLIFACGHALVCNKLCFIHPISNEKLEFELENTMQSLIILEQKC